jgi:hypothetical protein
LANYRFGALKKPKFLMLFIILLNLGCSGLMIKLLSSGTKTDGTVIAKNFVGEKNSSEAKSLVISVEGVICQSFGSLDLVNLKINSLGISIENL